MSMERGAWSGERRSRLSRVAGGEWRAERESGERKTGAPVLQCSGLFLAAGRTSQLGRGSSARWGGGAAGGTAAFSLLEMLFVIGIIAVLTALLVPSMQGLFGVVGRRGGANTLAMGFEQARLEAIKHGTAAFVGFPNAVNEDAFSSFIVYRALRFDESVTNPNLYIPVSRWVRLPRGVFIAPPTLAAAVNSTQNSIPSGLLPRLGGSNVTSLRSIKFDRFGKLVTTNTNTALRVGEGILTEDQLVFTPNKNNYYELTIQPLTGQVVMRDGAVEGGQP